MNRFKRSTTGFTLLELMVTIAIVAVAMAIGVPSFIAFQRNAELTRTANSLQASMNTARTEAMKRGMNAMVKPIDSSNWAKGWVVFVDVKRNGVATDTDNIVVYTQSPLTGAFTVTLSDADFIPSFDASGFARVAGGSPTPNGTFTIQQTGLTGAEQWKQTRKVMVSLAGRVRTCTPISNTDGNC
jgi:type IV fimbrial biogenesis protein FimT